MLKSYAGGLGQHSVSWLLLRKMAALSDLMGFSLTIMKVLISGLLANGKYLLSSV